MPHTPSLRSRLVLLGPLSRHITQSKYLGMSLRASRIRPLPVRSDLEAAGPYISESRFPNRGEQRPVIVNVSGAERAPQVLHQASYDATEGG